MTGLLSKNNRDSRSIGIPTLWVSPLCFWSSKDHDESLIRCALDIKGLTLYILVVLMAMENESWSEGYSGARANFIIQSKIRLEKLARFQKEKAAGIQQK